MEYDALRERIWFARYWLLAVFGLAVAWSAFTDGFALAALFVAAVSAVWIGLSLVEATG